MKQLIQDFKPGEIKLVDVPGILAELADVSVKSGPAMLRDEDGMLTGYVYVDVAGRDIGAVGSGGVARRHRHGRGVGLGGFPRKRVQAGGATAAARTVCVRRMPR